MAVVNKTDGTRLQVSFGHETALIYLWQVVKTNSANTIPGSPDSLPPERVSESPFRPVREKPLIRRPP